MRPIALLSICLWLPLASAAASDPTPQAPLTGHMLASPTEATATPAPSTPPALPPPPVDEHQRRAIGDTTHALLRMQADGTHAGPSRPILGVQADASYRRYLRSFEHDIPVFFRTTVDTDNTRPE